MTCGDDCAGPGASCDGSCRTVRIRCICLHGDVQEGIDLPLGEGERVVNIDHEGNVVWVYVESRDVPA